MIHKITLITTLTIILMGMISCHREEPGNEDKDKPLVFTSLTVARDTIFTEDTTCIRAEASGYLLTYSWYVEKGDLLGSGSEVTFLATPCTIGNNVIYCTIRDGNALEETKEVVVTVL